MTKQSEEFSWLPAVLRPRDDDDGGGLGRRAAELAVLVVLGLLLTAATVNDVKHQIRVVERVAIDKSTWTAFTHHKVKRLFVTPGVGATTDTACAPPATGAQYRLCLVLTGPTSPRRTISGGFRLPQTGDNRYRRRYGCFGSARAAGLCGSSGP
jgi:hypothetical protein